jgi:hypothetical protein
VGGDAGTTETPHLRYNETAETVDEGVQLMSAIRGKYVDGAVVLDAPANWPNGTEVVVEPAPVVEPLGLREEDWPTTPEGIAALVARMDQFEAIELTPEEEADIAAWRQKMKEYTIAHMNDRIDELFP